MQNQSADLNDPRNGPTPFAGQRIVTVTARTMTLLLSFTPSPPVDAFLNCGFGETKVKWQLAP